MREPAVLAGLPWAPDTERPLPYVCRATAPPVSTASTPQPSLALTPRLRALVQTLQQRRARTMADRELARRLHAAVGASKLPVAGLNIYVHDGAISIYGPVSDETTREAVLVLAAEQPGARRVVDHLRLTEA